MQRTGITCILLLVSKNLICVNESSERAVLSHEAIALAVRTDASRGNSLAMIPLIKAALVKKDYHSAYAWISRFNMRSIQDAACHTEYESVLSSSNALVQPYQIMCESAISEKSKQRILFEQIQWAERTILSNSLPSPYWIGIYSTNINSSFYPENEWKIRRKASLTLYKSEMISKLPTIRKKANL